MNAGGVPRMSIVHALVVGLVCNQPIGILAVSSASDPRIHWFRDRAIRVRTIDELPRAQCRCAGA